MSPENSIFADLTNENTKIKHYTQSVTQNIHHFYLFGDIDDNIDKYCDFLNMLKTASELDTIVIYINSDGGSIRMTTQIINSMMAAQAKVVTVLDGHAVSAATMIFLAGDEYVVHDNCSFMIHTYTGGMYGKGPELVSQFKHVNDSTKKLLTAMYTKILTEDELERVIIDGKDIWLDSDELIKRLEQNDRTVFQDLDSECCNGVKCGKGCKE